MQIRTDLALEAREMINEKKSEKMKENNSLPEGMFVDTTENEYVTITEIQINSDEAMNAIGKKKGKYITLELKQSLLDTIDIQENTAMILAEEIKKVINETAKNSPQFMIVGLGNRNITADSLGPKVTDKIVVTRHIKNLQNKKNNENLGIDNRLGNICAIAPGVMGVTGIETSEIIKGMISTIKPDLLLVIDALASRKATRVNSTIQISDTGIVPGSGVGNHRMELSKEVLGIPVISVGVPTVVDALTLVKDILDVEERDFTELENNDNIANMIVTPKNIDIAIERISDVLASAINMAIHHGFKMQEINEYLIWNINQCLCDNTFL